MKSSKLINIFKERNIVIPMFFLKNIKKLNLEPEEFLFLMYLYNLGDKYLFDPNQFSNDLDWELSTVMNYIDILTNKGFMRVEVLKNEKGLMEDVVLLDGFFRKLMMITVDEVNNDEEKATFNVFEMIEKEFGRTLSPIEYEIINAWLENHTSEELIKEAVKEATFNGVSNLRYIDKILYEWGKAGIQSVQQVEEMRAKHNHKVEKEADVDMDIVDWNWFDEDE